MRELTSAMGAFMGLKSLLGGVAVCLVSVTSQAMPNFSYLNLGYARESVSRESHKCTQDGLMLSISVPLNEWYYAIAGHTDQTSSSWCGATKTRLGAGIHYDIGTVSALYGELSAMLADYPWDESVGGTASFGIRTIPVHGTELKGFMMYESVDGNEVSLFGVGVNMWMNQEFSGFLDLAFGGDSEKRIQLGMRYNF